MSQNNISFRSVLKLCSKVLSWAIFIVLSIAAIFLFYYFIATKLYAIKGPGYEPKFSIYTIASGSMTPNINVYDTVINVKIDNPGDIKVGDVITFISNGLDNPGMTVTHRVIEIKTSNDGEVCYQTKGDYNPIADTNCAKFSNLIGKVIFRIPQLGRIQFFLASRAGWLLCILVPALVIIIKDILKIFKLNEIQSTASKMSENKRNTKKLEQEKNRKDELKRKLLKSDNSVNSKSDKKKTSVSKSRSTAKK